MDTDQDEFLKRILAAALRQKRRLPPQK